MVRPSWEAHLSRSSCPCAPVGSVCGVAPSCAGEGSVRAAIMEPGAVAHTVEARAFNSVLGVAQDRNITSGQASLDIDEPSGLRQGGPSRTFLVAILLWD